MKSVFNALLLVVTLFSQLSAASERLVVVTSYPQEVISHFEAAFEDAYPSYQLAFIWKQSNDALTFITSQQNVADVYWTPSKSNFTKLSQAGALIKLDDGLLSSVGSIHGVSFNDPNGYYAATEIAGLGMVVNPAEIANLKLTPPTDWTDLAAPNYKAKVAFPIPSKIGFATGLLGAMMQGKTWEEGWQTIVTVAANAKLVDSGATFITDEVASGKQAVGITMDFFAASAIAKGANLRYVYPLHVTYSPAHIAILKNASNVAGAKAFVAFALSTQGQALLFHPDIRKLPVNERVYAQKPSGYFNPFQNEANTANILPYKDEPTKLGRLAVLNSMFDAAITLHHARLVAIYSQYHEAVRASPNDERLHAVITLITSPVASEMEVNDLALQHAFSVRTKEEKAERLAKQHEAAWANLANERYKKASLLLDDIVAKNIN